MKQRKVNFRNNPLRSLLCSNLILLISGISSIPGYAGQPAGVPAHRPGFNKDRATRYVRSFDFESLRLAIEDLTGTFGQDYPKGRQYLKQLESLRKLSKAAIDSTGQNDDSLKVNLPALADKLEKLRYNS